jgi:hypothetical protein
MIGSGMGRHRWFMAALLVVAACACGCGSSDVVKPPDGSCVNMGTATYAGTEDMITSSGACPNYPGLAVTFSIVQAAGSCDFTLQSSRISGKTFSGTVSGSNISWTGSYPSASGTVTFTGVNAVLSANLDTLSGSFNWSYAGNTSCTGTTTFHLVKQ